MSKKYNIGFYGGKFMPLHKGHRYCIDTMMKECEQGFVIIFINGNDEDEIAKNGLEDYLLPQERIQSLLTYCTKYIDNICVRVIDCEKLKLPDGTEDWDAETPLVRAICGDRIDAVYGSEVSYSDYFTRAYPEATYRLVDPPRIKYPISGTACRNMKEEERKLWVN